MLEIPKMTMCLWFVYLLLTLFGSLVVRIVNSIWKAFESEEPSLDSDDSHDFRHKFWAAFKGSGWRVNGEGPEGGAKGMTDGPRREQADYWQAFVLGWLELISYPLLIFSEKAPFIGAWLAFKTVHRWNYSPELNRGFYNRYLVSNGAILVGSFLLATLVFGE